MPAIPVHDTAVIDEPWDADAQIKKLPDDITKSIAQGMWTWYDAAGKDADDDGYPDQKGDYKLPHHQVDANGKPSAANVNGVRNALSRLPQSDIPDADQEAVRRHLQHHLDAFNHKTGDAPSDSSAIAAPLIVGEVDLKAARAAAHLAFSRTPISVLPTKVSAMVEQAARELVFQGSSAAMRRPTANMTVGGKTVAVIPLRGTITPRGSLFSILFGGGGGLQGFRAQFREAMADDTVSSIVIDIDSPGGLIDLVPETAAEVRAARGQGKRIIAIANTLAASAAYWIAAQADQVIVTPSGMVGSVGVFTVHEDYSRMEEMMGIKTTLISAGDHKTDGNPYEPLSKAALASLQEQVDALYAMFTADVAEGRGQSVQAIRAGYGQGAAVMADRALQLKMVDGIATFEETIASLGGGAADPAPSPEDLDVDDDEMEAAAALTPPASTQDLAPEDGATEEPTPVVDYLGSTAVREHWRI